MEVGLERVDRFEFVWRVEEDVGFTGAGGDFAVSDKVFEDSGDSGSDGSDFGRLLHFCGGIYGEFVAFGVHVVITRVFGFDWAEGADADVESEEGVVDFGEHFRGEMQARGGRGDGSFFFGVDGLVAIAVCFIRLAFHVVREGEVAVFFEIWRGVPLNESFAFFVCLYDGSSMISNFNRAPGFHFFTGTNETPPVMGVGGVGADEFDFPII